MELERCEYLIQAITAVALHDLVIEYNEVSVGEAFHVVCGSYHAVGPMLDEALLRLAFHMAAYYNSPMLSGVASTCPPRPSRPAAEREMETYRRAWAEVRRASEKAGG